MLTSFWRTAARLRSRPSRRGPLPGDRPPGLENSATSPQERPGGLLPKPTRHTRGGGSEGGIWLIWEGSGEREIPTYRGLFDFPQAVHNSWRSGGNPADPTLRTRASLHSSPPPFGGSTRPLLTGGDRPSPFPRSSTAGRCASHTHLTDVTPFFVEPWADSQGPFSTGEPPLYEEGGIKQS